MNETDVMYMNMAQTGKHDIEHIIRMISSARTPEERATALAYAQAFLEPSLNMIMTAVGHFSSAR